MGCVNILVTGGAGFVGSSLIAAMIKDKSLNITSLDNYFTGTKDNHVEGVTYIEGDCCDISDLIPEVPDVVFHFGEYSRVSTSFEDKDLVWEYNIKGTYEVLKFCVNRGSKLIYSASSTKFGDNGDNRNASPYAFFKSQNTDLINNFHKWFGLNYVICYFYNVYGSGQISTGKYATVIGIFEEQYLNEKPLTIVQPGTQKRDFTHIDDVVHGLILLLEKGDGDGYCFGTSQSYEINEIAKMFKDDVKYIIKRKGERQDSSIDLTKSLELGWKAQNNLKDYIQKFKERIK